MKQAFKGIVWGLILLLFIFGTYVAYLNQQNIKDIIAARNFTPTEDILEIQTRVELTPLGQRVFYASNPQVEERDLFNESCNQSIHFDEGSLLGCFVKGQIHLFDIDDKRLDGIVEVTAAHELLHAAYSRFTQKQITDLQPRLLAAYEEAANTKPSLLERMAVYGELSDSAFANELHSILGTEVEELPLWLEEHYSKWFSDRDEIVDLYSSYSDYLGLLRARGENLITKIDELTDSINDELESYSSLVQEFNLDYEDFVRRNQAFEFSSNPDEFYAIRSALEVRREFLEGERVRIEELISEHEDLRVQLEDLNMVTREIRESMDSSLPTPTSED